MTNRSPRNKTIVLTDDDRQELEPNLVVQKGPLYLYDIKDKTIKGDAFDILPMLPDDFIDLLIVDPPYNVTKTFNGKTFREMPMADYEGWVDMWISKTIQHLKSNASIYVCCDWQSSSAIYRVLSKYFKVRNRISWGREKGRGSKTNWKNCTEDIWYCTLTDDFIFNVDAVKLKRRVIAPYRNDKGNPKDWRIEQEGNFRLTYPSNFWNDISIPFWSMTENTDHPTQKPEKLLAKLILASSNPGDLVFDPFLGSGSTSVVAKKLDRNYVGIEQELEYCLIAEKRLQQAEKNKIIQGYSDGCFFERNTFNNQKRKKSMNS